MNMKKYFELGMLSLLESKYIDDITVGELISEVGSCKGTFYKHYIDKYDLCCSSFKNHVFNGVDANAASWKKYSMQLLNAFEKNAKVIIHAFESSDCNSARNSFENSLLSYLSREFTKNGGDLNSATNKMAMELCCKSVTDILMHWIKSTKKESKDTMQELLYAVMPQSIYEYVCVAS